MIQRKIKEWGRLVVGPAVLNRGVRKGLTETLTGGEEASRVRYGGKALQGEGTANAKPADASQALSLPGALQEECGGWLAGRG